MKNQEKVWKKFCEYPPLISQLDAISETRGAMKYFKGRELFSLKLLA